MGLHSQLLSGFPASTQHWYTHNEVCVLHLEISLPDNNLVSIQCCECVHAHLLWKITCITSLSFKKKTKKKQLSVLKTRPFDVYALRFLGSKEDAQKAQIPHLRE